MRSDLEECWRCRSTSTLHSCSRILHCRGKVNYPQRFYTAILGLNLAARTNFLLLELLILFRFFSRFILSLIFSCRVKIIIMIKMMTVSSLCLWKILQIFCILFCSPAILLTQSSDWFSNLQYIIDLPKTCPTVIEKIATKYICTLMIMFNCCCRQMVFLTACCQCFAFTTTQLDMLIRAETR